MRERRGDIVERRVMEWCRASAKDRAALIALMMSVGGEGLSGPQQNALTGFLETHYRVSREAARLRRRIVLEEYVAYPVVKAVAALAEWLGGGRG